MVALIWHLDYCIVKMAVQPIFLYCPLSTESTRGVSRERPSVAADRGPGSKGFREDFYRGTGPHSARLEALAGVLVATVQHESQSPQVSEKNESSVMWVSLMLCKE